jgi:hypothetical protein
METIHSLTPATARTFLLAGRAIFTVSNPAGERYTFRIDKMDAKKARDPQNLPYFAKFLTGSDNENDYSYLGLLLTGETLSVRATAKSPANAATEHKPFRVLGWALQVLTGGRELPAGYKIQHEGRCGRCGRTLTVPESIEAGIGPECATKMGL